jgi:hypothetical protein
MDPAVWAPAIATLATPLVQLLITGIQSRLDNRRRADGTPVSLRSNAVLLTANLTALPVAVAVVLVPPPWNWTIGGAYVVASVFIVLGYAIRRRRRPSVHPGAARLLQEGARPSPGFEYDRDFLPDLVRVYTRNDLARERGSGDPDDRERTKDLAPEQRVTFDKVLLDPKVRHIAITGEAGIGKTFLLRYWHQDLKGRNPAASDPLSKFRPLLVAARKLVGCAAIADAFPGDGRDILARPPGKGLTWLVMIDAFDEITDPSDRAAVEQLVFDAIGNAPNTDSACKFVITTRGLTDDRRRSFESRGVTEYELQTFTPQQLRDFLIKAETSIPDREERNARYTAAVSKVDRFLKRWEHHDDLLELIRLPLLARVAATVYFQDRHLELPARRVDIYHDAIEHWIDQFHKRMAAERDAHGPALELLHQWDPCGGADAEPDRASTDAAIRKLLRDLAVQYLRTGQRSVVGIACDLLELQVRPKDPGQLEALLTLLEATGLVHDVRTIGAHFVHKSYAEFLAAPAKADEFVTSHDWNDAFKDPERRIGAIFAFNQIPEAERQTLIAALREDGGCVHALGWIAVEGLCAVSGTGRIDGEVRNALIETVIEAWPAYPKAEWWNLVSGLCVLAHARDLMLEMVDRRHRADHELISVSSNVARHDPRGIDRLRRFVTGDHPLGVLDAAAAELVDHDPETARTHWEQIVAAPWTPDGFRGNAIARLVEHWPTEWTPRLRQFVADQTVEPQSRVVAAAKLGKYDRDASAGRLRAFFAAPEFDGAARALAAYRLCDHDLELGTSVLRGFTEDQSMPEWQRVLCAYRLASYERELGVSLLRRFTVDRTLDDSTRIGALANLRDFELDEAIHALHRELDDRRLGSADRAHAARVLAFEGDPRGREELESIAGDPSVLDNDRDTAMYDLLNFDRGRWTEQLRRFAADGWTDDSARVAAASSLIWVDYCPAMELLAEFAADTTMSDYSRMLANWHLRNQGAPSMDRQVEAVAMDEKVDGDIRVWAASSLIPSARDAGVTLLRRLSADDGIPLDDRAAALSSLIQAGAGESPTELLAMADSPVNEGRARVEAAKQCAMYLPMDAADALLRLGADTDLMDGDRVEAAKALVKLEAEAGKSLLFELAAPRDGDDRARVTAATALADLDLTVGLPLLLELAQDASGHFEASVDAAAYLADCPGGPGPSLLAAQAEGADLDDVSMVRAARLLLEYDPDRSAALLEDYAMDFRLQDRAQVNAAVGLACIDRAAGNRRLGRIAAAEAEAGGRAALAAGWITRLNASEGERLLRDMATGNDEIGPNSVFAAVGLLRFDRKLSIDLLRMFAEGSDIDDCVRVSAAGELALLQRRVGVDLLERICEDGSVDAVVRVDAADTLTRYDFPRWLDRLRCFVQDEAISDSARVAAAMCISFERKREGQKVLTALSQDESLSATGRCWAEVNLAVVDLKTRASLGRPRPASQIDFGVLREETSKLIRMDWRTGHRMRRWVELVEASTGSGR